MPKYRIEFTRHAQQELLALDRIKANRIIEKLSFFIAQENPLLFSKKLVGRENTYRFRIGDYRATFSIQEDGTILILLILKIAHRKDVYE